MYKIRYVFCVSAVFLCCLQVTKTAQEADDIAKIFSACHRKSPDFDACMKRALNKIRPFFKVGIPELNVAPFDPHFAKEVRQVRKFFGLGYTLTLRDVYEGGWSQSTVTKYKTDWENERIIYSQYFPEKWLNGDYEFKGDMLGLGVLRAGRWNMTLRDYSQTTRIKRSGEGVDVHVEIDHIGDMEIHVGNLLRGNGILVVRLHTDHIGDMEINIGNLLRGNGIIERGLDRLINAAWKPGFAVIRPLINDLVSTAFTDIFSHSFRNFLVDRFIQE